MRIKYRFVFNPSLYPHVFDAIASLTNKFNLSKEMTLNTVEIFQGDEFAAEIISIMDAAEINGFPETLYSQNELSKASWLQIFPLWSQYYIQPSATFPQNTFKTHGCETCYYECEQINDFALGERPKKWTKRFLNIHVPDELLVPDEVADILTTSNLRGFHFRQVVDAKTGNKIPNINQLVTERTLAKGRIFFPSGIRVIERCPNCGYETVVPHLPELHQYEMKIFEEVEEDIVKTGEKYRGSQMYRSRLIISHRFYDVLKKNKLDKDLTFYVVDVR